MKYVVIHDYRCSWFIQTVNENISLGWELQGGICVELDSSGTENYYQAMVYRHGSE